MDTKKKIQYIWDYYKFHIFGVLFLIYVLISLLNYWIINPPKKIISKIIILEENINKNKAYELENYLNEKYNEDNDKFVIDIDIWDLRAPLGLHTKLKFMIAAGMVDGLITGKDNLDYFDRFQMFNPILETNENGIKIIENNLTKKLVFGKEIYVSLIANSSHKEITKKIARDITMTDILILNIN